MGYYIDLAGISIDEYREILRSGDLLPSQMVLKEDIDDIFKSIKGQGIEDVEQLRIALRSKKKLQEFSRQSGISEDYLKILIRNVNSYRQKPNQIRDLPGISESVIQKLESLGLKNTLQLYDRILTSQSRNELSSRTGVSENDILRLAKLTDLCRIRWVNHTFAYVLLETGYGTAEEVANAAHQELYEKVKKLNEERGIFKGHIGVHDMKLCVEAARALPFEIKY